MWSHTPDSFLTHPSGSQTMLLDQALGIVPQDFLASLGYAKIQNPSFSSTQCYSRTSANRTKSMRIAKIASVRLGVISAFVSRKPPPLTEAVKANIRNSCPSLFFSFCLAATAAVDTHRGQFETSSDAKW